MTNIIGYIPKPTLQLIANNTNKYSNRNDIDIKAVIELILVKLKERCPNIQNHIKTDELWDRSKHSFDITDSLTVYYNDIANTYHLGKWKISTIEGNATYHSSLFCSTVYKLAEYLTNHINHTKYNNNADRLQEKTDTCGERDQSKGVAIKVTRGCITVESRQISNGTIISC